jgi:dienelactone hydrolase
VDRARGRVAVVAAAAVGLAGCGGESRPELSVVPRESGIEAPLRVVVRGLEPGERVTVSASATADDKMTWRSSASFRADRFGTVDLGRARSLGGSYTGTDGSALLWSMRPQKGESEFFVAPLPSADLRIEATARGRPAAVQRVSRLIVDDAVEVFPLRPAGVRLFGELFRPASPSGAAVLVLGGSEGGLSTIDIAARLAARGHPALALAYFGETGLPTGVWRIKLEYFARALRRLRDEEGDKVAILGISLGAEAALLTASRYPELVDGVVGIAPTAAVGPGEFGRPAWTHRGRAVPHMTVAQAGNPSLTPARALIPIEKARAPVLTAAGDDDAMWPSDEYARMIRERLERSPGRGHRHLLYEGAGHGIVACSRTSRGGPT